MAKILFTAFMADARGKVAGSVFSKNRSGAYIRTKVTPTNPSTTSQSGARSRFTGFSQGWRGLTQDQRNAWRDATQNFPKTNQFGSIYYLSGSALYQSLNNTLQTVGGTPISDPPLPQEVAALVSISLTMAKGTPAASLVYSPTPVPADTAFMVFATQGVSAGIAYVKNQYRLIEVLDAADVSPANILASYTTKFGTVPNAGLKVYVKVVPVNKVTGQQGIGLETYAIVAS